MIRIKVITLFPRINNLPFLLEEKPTIAMWSGSGLPQEREEIWSRALTYFSSVIEHVGLIQTRFPTAATVSCVPRKTVQLFRYSNNVYSSCSTNNKIQRSTTERIQKKCEGKTELDNRKECADVRFDTWPKTFVSLANGNCFARLYI